MKKQIITLVFGLYGLIRLGQILTPLIKSIEWTVDAVIVISAIGLLIFISYNSFTDLYAGSLASDIGSMRQKLMKKVYLNYNTGSSAPDSKSTRERQISSDNEADYLQSVNNKERADDNTASEASKTNTQSTTPVDETSTDSESSAGEHRAAAETAIQRGETDRSKNDFTAAANAYSRALKEHQAALSKLQAENNEERSEIEDAIESTRADLETVKTRRDQRNDFTDTLRPAERSFQEAIAAFVTGDQTIARIRFRQARDALSEARETLDQSDVDVLSPPIEVAVEPDQALSSTTLSEIQAIPDAAVSTLSDAGVETVSDLTSSDGPPWPPQEVTTLADTSELTGETVTKLTALS